MPESRAQQVAAAVRAALATIVEDGGATFWLTPSRVLQTHEVNSELLNDQSLRTIYVVSPDRKEEQRATSGTPIGIVRTRQFLTLTLITRYTPAGPSPFKEPAVNRWTLQERMQRDVRKKLRQDVKLGGVSTDLDITDSEESATETYEDGWAVTFVRLMVLSHYYQETP